MHQPREQFAGLSYSKSKPSVETCTRAHMQETAALNPLYEEKARWVVPANGALELVVLFQVGCGLGMGVWAKDVGAKGVGGRA